MKTKQFLFLGLVCLSTQFTNAQATVANATNTTNATNYLGSGATSNFDVLFKRNNINAGLLGTLKTAFGVNALAMPNSVSIGVGAGQFSSGTGFNTYIGHAAGRGSSVTLLNTGTSNAFFGNLSGTFNSTGTSNVFLGYASGNNNTTGSGNIFIGVGTGTNNLGGNGNVCIGFENNTEYENYSNNTYLGNRCASEAIGSNNVYIGNEVGFYEQASNRLMIANTQTNTPLIWGDFANSQLKLHGKVAIGGNSTTPIFTTFPINSGAINNVANYNLFVKGGILTEEIRVSLATTWADYVFSKDYKMPTLPELEKQIQEKGHLPNMPSAKEVKESGIELGEMAKMQQEKIEELTLYIIQINKELQELKAKSKN